MMTYGGDDSDPSSGKLEVTLLDGSTTDTPEFLFEDTAEEGIGPASISAFIDGCLGRDYLYAPSLPPSPAPLPAV